MFVFMILSVTIALAAGSQSNYNAFNKPQQQSFHSVQSQSGHYQNYQHQTHHNQFNQQQTPHHQSSVAQQQHRYQTQPAFQASRNFIPITSFKNDLSHDGTYQYSYSTGNGIKADESGYLKHLGQNKAQVVQGSYSYTSPEGIPIHVQYTADEYGFKASGNHLPTPPPVPVEIQKSLQLIARTQPAPATHPWQNQHQQQVGGWQAQTQSHQQVQHQQWQPQHQKWN